MPQRKTRGLSGFTVTPTTWLGRGLVIAQTSLGVSLVIVVIAHWVASIRDTKRDDTIA